MKTQIRLLGALALLAALAGCRTFSHSCDAPPSHGSAETLPTLQVPPGLQAPDTRNALAVPELNEPQRPRAKSERCLDEPPAYAPNLNLGRKPSKARKARKSDPKVDDKSSESTGKAEEKPQQ